MTKSRGNYRIYFKTRIAQVYLREDDIMDIRISGKESLNVEDIRELVNQVGIHGKEKKFKNLITITSVSTISFDVREYSVTEERNKYTIADAFVIDSFALQVLGNFYLNFHKPIRPTRLFMNEHDALKWLKAV